VKQALRYFFRFLDSLDKADGLNFRDATSTTFPRRTEWIL
jgi:hypothetical protein